VGVRQNINTWQIRVFNLSRQPLEAILAPALIADMPPNWSFAWPEFWQDVDFACEQIIKLVYEQEILGLIRYGLYPYPLGARKESLYLVVEHLEALPKGQRLVDPVGKWLMWYACKAALEFCSPESQKPLVTLIALEQAEPYYKNQIKMEFRGCKTIAPGEEGYVFQFSRVEAEAFCRGLESEFGIPRLLT
jgi:hypothetical protein